jgi:hypothetical protein
VRLLLATEAAVLPRASVHGLPRRGYLLYATLSRTTRKRRVAIVFRSQVHCGIMFCNAIPMLIPPTPSANQMHRPYQLSGSTVCLRGTLCGECALLLSVHSNSIPRISPISPLSIDQKHLLCLHIGHCPLEESCLSHSTMQCYSHQL